MELRRIEYIGVKNRARTNTSFETLEDLRMVWKGFYLRCGLAMVYEVYF